MSMDGPFRYPALLWLKLCQTERLRFSGMLVPLFVQLLRQRQAMCGFSSCSCSQSAFPIRLKTGRGL